MDKECEERLEKIVEGFGKCSNAFTAIGNETRQRILIVLLESDAEGIRVGEIAEKAYLTRPSVSHHLKVLKEAGIVDMKSAGTKNYYYINLDKTIIKDMTELINLIYKSVNFTAHKHK